MWGAILEKAWAKVKGSYDYSDGGSYETGFRSLTGAPVFSYKTSAITSTALANDAWTMI